MRRQIHRLWLRLRTLARRRQLDRDLEEELRFHLEMKMADGAGPWEARRRLGNVAGLKEACRDMWTFRSLETWWQDARYAARTLAKNPGFTAIAFVALALGIGANATVYTLVNAVIFKSPPFVDSNRVVYVGMPYGMSYPDYRDFAAESKSIRQLAASSRCAGDLSDGAGLPLRIDCSVLTANAFGTIGQKPAIGRDFLPEDARPESPRVAIVAYSLWESRYGRDPGIVGRRIRLVGEPTTIVGVMPRGLRFPASTEVWIPLVPGAGWEHREDRNIEVFGRLAPGVGAGTARAEAATIAARIASAHPETNSRVTALVQTFNEAMVRKKIRNVFLVLLGAVGFVLLIVCANVANLMLARAVARSREISLRAALGASRWRIVRQLLIESLLLAAAGGAAGTLLSIWATRVFDAAITPTGKPPWIVFTTDYHVLAYVAGISLGTGILFGLMPALRVSHLNLMQVLKDGGRGASAGIRGRYLSGVLVVAEMAIAVVLLAGAGLMVRSFLNAYASPIGVNTANVLAMRIDLPPARYAQPASRVAFQQQLKKALEALPGAESATVASHLPGINAMRFTYELEGAPPVDERSRPRSSAIVIGTDYFRVMDVRVAAGRAFTAEDEARDQPVVLVNRTFAARIWPNQDPLGKRLRVFQAGRPQPWLTVVGVAPDILQEHRSWDDRDALLYLPYRQQAPREFSIMGRTRVLPGTLTEAFRRAVQEIDRDLPVDDIMPLDQRLALENWPIRVFGTMFAVFAVFALVLASVGLYGVVANGVEQRRHEIGVRVAMGATARDVLSLVFAQGFRQLGLGLAIGLALAWFVTRLLSDLLGDVTPHDPATFASVAGVLVLAGLAGCGIPARRAMQVDPVDTLRHE